MGHQIDRINRISSLIALAAAFIFLPVLAVPVLAAEQSATNMTTVITTGVQAANSVSGAQGVAVPTSVNQPIAPPAPPAAVAPPTVNVVPVKTVFVAENQPVQIIDAQGRLLQIIYLKRK